MVDASQSLPYAQVGAEEGKPVARLLCTRKRAAVWVSGLGLVVLAVVLCVYFLVLDDDSASVTLQVRNVQGDSSRRLLQGGGIDPYYIGVKMTAVYLAHDVDPKSQSNIGPTSMFWINPECKMGISDCNADGIHTFFNFTQSSADIKKQLGEQHRRVAAGTYSYVRMEFCKYGVHSNNWEFLAPGMRDTFGFMMNECAVTAAISPPLVLAKRSSIVIALDFNPAGSVYRSGTAQGNCDPDGYCLNPPSFYPKVLIPLP